MEYIKKLIGFQIEEIKVRTKVSNRQVVVPNIGGRSLNFILNRMQKIDKLIFIYRVQGLFTTTF